MTGSSASRRLSLSFSQKFRSNRKYFLIGGSRGVVSCGGMGVFSGSAREEAGSWSKPDRVRLAAPKELAGRSSTKIHLAVVCSLFLILVLFAATLLVGGRAAIGPILQSAAEERDAHSAGDIVYTMPGGVLCRHVSYDNVTGQETAGSIEPCKSDIAQDRWHVTRRFSWQSN